MYKDFKAMTGRQKVICAAFFLAGFIIGGLAL